MTDTPQAEATRRAELLVSSWHRENRMYLGQGAGIDRQAKVALIRDIAAGLAPLIAEVETLRADAPALKPAGPKKAVTAKG